MPNPPPYSAIYRLLKTGSVVPFLGAGASLIPLPEEQRRDLDTTAADRPWTTAVPSGFQLLQYLADEAGLDLGNDTSVELATVAQYYAAVVGRPDLYRALHDIFSAEYPFGQVHRFLAKLPTPLLVLTTNYDSMIERAFQAAQKPFDLIIHQTNDDARAGSVVFKPHDGPPQTIPPNHVVVDLERTSVIYKMHGTAAPQGSLPESYVITEDDYIDFLIRLGSNTPIPSMISEAFIERHFLFLGYGLADWNFRVVLASLQEHLRRQPSWAIRWRGSAIEEDIWKSRGVRMYDLRIEDFVQELCGS
jgi:SIR2-like domain